MKKLFFIWLLILISACSSNNIRNWNSSLEALCFLDELKVGDIIVLEKTKMPMEWFGHSALVVKKGVVGEYGKPFVRKIDKNYEESYLKDWIYKNKDRKFKFYRIKNYDNYENINLEKIINKYKLKNYSFFAGKKNINKVYCSSWIYQVYLEAYKIKIDSNKGYYVLPYDFICSKYLEEVIIK
jgi:uncharacterized protein YycO